MKLTVLSLAMLAGATVLAAQAPNLGGQGNAFFAGPGTHGASLHGVPLLPGTSILQGETVTTGPNGVAVLAPTHGAGGVLELTANASATVHAGDITAGQHSDQLDLKTGDALVTGNVAVTTPQGQTFQADRTGTSYVVNAQPQQSRMGVLTGAVTTYNRVKPQAQVIPAGNAVQVSANAAGVTQISSIKLAQVNKPAANTAAPQVTTASQSQ